MCGIVGIFSPGAPDQPAHATRMRDAIAHRGPDDAGLYQSPDRRVILGHRRLSIVDLSAAGHQPMSNEDGTVWLVFNGEIYNHAALRPDLEARGHVFRSRTDTEVILHLYEEEGVECLSRLDGMFALALWDERRRQLLLARDRLGKKPLYYTRAGGRLLFASEIKALLAHPGVSRDLDLEAMDLYLTFSNTPPPRTLFAGISKLPAAHRLVMGETGATAIERYWSPLGGRPWGDRQIDEEEAAAEVRARLESAVRKRMMSDVPIGCFLSGGVDSSANVALMSALSDRPLQTYSVGFEGFGPAENFHDLPYAREVAARFGCRHRELTVTAEECRGYLPELVYDQDEPIADPACLPMHFLCRVVRRDGVVVVLVGEGSDEVFGGYEDMAHVLTSAGPRFEQVRRLPSLVRASLHRASRLLGAPAGRVDLLRRAREDEPLYWGLDVAFWETEKADLLTTRAAAPFSFVKEVYAELAARQPGADLLQQMSALELANRLPELLLMRVDKISMAHSLEARAPFLDADLVSYALSLPQRLKIRGMRETKYILKQALRPLLPASVLDRHKQGFRVPLPEWLRGPLAGWARRQVLEGPLAERGVFRRAYLERLWRRHLSGQFDHSYDLWCLINLGAWYERWIEPRAAA
jgi:asparagine synthase (glutamine-hydrolysing)